MYVYVLKAITNPLSTGTAYTFISLKEEQYAPVMVKVIEKAGQTPVPPELLEMSKQFKSKVAKGVHSHLLTYIYTIHTYIMLQCVHLLFKNHIYVIHEYINSFIYMNTVISTTANLNLTLHWNNPT